MKKILIIDDDKNFVETLGDLLREKIGSNLDITVFGNVKDALIYLSENIPDIIILDVQLEGMHGFEFLEMLKNNVKFSKVPVIMISAKYTEPIDRMKALRMGAVGYFIKPVDLEKLYSEIREYIGR